MRICGTSGLVSCLVAVVLWSRCSELPTASPANQARVYCWYTRVIPPPRQGGGGTRAPALTYVATSGGVVVHVVVPERVDFLCSAVWFPHSSSNDVACVVVRSRSSSGQHLLDPRLCVCQISKLIQVQLVQEILGRVNDSSIVLALSLVSLVSHVSENPRAPSLHLWTTHPAMSGHASFQRGSY